MLELKNFIRASAIGIVPNISPYIGTPTTVGSNTANGLSLPSILSIMSCIY